MINTGAYSKYFSCSSELYSKSDFENNRIPLKVVSFITYPGDLMKGMLGGDCVSIDIPGIQLVVDTGLDVSKDIDELVMEVLSGHKLIAEKRVVGSRLLLVLTSKNIYPMEIYIGYTVAYLEVRNLNVPIETDNSYLSDMVDEVFKGVKKDINISISQDIVSAREFSNYSSGVMDGHNVRVGNKNYCCFCGAPLVFKEGDMVMCSCDAAKDLLSLRRLNSRVDSYYNNLSKKVIEAAKGSFCLFERFSDPKEVTYGVKLKMGIDELLEEHNLKDVKRYVDALLEEEG